MSTKIEWTQETWNVFTGCSKVSEACRNCYAERFAKRLRSNPVAGKKYRNGFKFTFHPEELKKPYRWKTPRMIFVNSMSDTFHEEATDEMVRAVWKVMEENPHHIFQVLTKRPHRAVRMLIEGVIYPLPNVWMGVTIEHKKYIRRSLYLQHFKDFPVRFVSIEPMLSPLSEIEPFLKDGTINWVIVGGETGKGARPMREEWVLEIKELCERYEVPFFFKQWGAEVGKGGRLLGGREYSEMPEVVTEVCELSVQGLSLFWNKNKTHVLIFGKPNMGMSIFGKPNM